jgi:hypothetical protein
MNQTSAEPVRAFIAPGDECALSSRRRVGAAQYADNDYRAGPVFDTLSADVESVAKSDV